MVFRSVVKVGAFLHMFEVSSIFAATPIHDRDENLVDEDSGLVDDMEPEQITAYIARLKGDETELQEKLSAARKDWEEAKKMLDVAKLDKEQLIQRAKENLFEAREVCRSKKATAEKDLGMFEKSFEMWKKLEVIDGDPTVDPVAKESHVVYRQKENLRSAEKKQAELQEKYDSLTKAKKSEEKALHEAEVQLAAFGIVRCGDGNVKVHDAKESLKIVTKYKDEALESYEEGKKGLKNMEVKLSESEIIKTSSEKEYKESVTQCEEAQMETNDKRAEIAKLEAELRYLNEMEQGPAIKRAANDSLKETNEAKRAEQEKEVDATKEKIKTLEEKIMEKRKEKSTAQSEVDDKLRVKREAKSKADTASSIYNEHQKDVYRQEKAVQILEGVLGKGENDVKSATDAKKDADAALVEAENERASKFEELDTIKARIESITKDMNDAKIELDKNKLRVDDAKSDLDRAEKDKTEAENEVLKKWQTGLAERAVILEEILVKERKLEEIVESLKQGKPAEDVLIEDSTFNRVYSKLVPPPLHSADFDLDAGRIFLHVHLRKPHLHEKRRAVIYAKGVFEYAGDEMQNLESELKDLRSKIARANARKPSPCNETVVPGAEEKVVAPEADKNAGAGKKPEAGKEQAVVGKGRDVGKGTRKRGGKGKLGTGPAGIGETPPRAGSPQDTSTDLSLPNGKENAPGGKKAFLAGGNPSACKTTPDSSKPSDSSKRSDSKGSPRDLDELAFFTGAMDDLSGGAVDHADDHPVSGSVDGVAENVDEEEEQTRSTEKDIKNANVLAPDGEVGPESGTDDKGNAFSRSFMFVSMLLGMLVL